MLGWSYYRTERFADAANAYRRATAADPKNAEGWSALGEAISLAGQGDVPAEAEAAFRKALAIDPADPRARYFLAVKKDLAGDHKGAIDDWIALLKDTPPGAPWEAERARDDHAGRRQERDRRRRTRARPRRRRAAPSAPNAATDAIPGPTREQMSAAAALPPSQQDAMVKGMVEFARRQAQGQPQRCRRLAAADARADGARRPRRRDAGAGATAAPPSPAMRPRRPALTEGARALGVPGA